MSHSQKYNGWQGVIVRLDSKIPFILWGLLVSLVLTTGLESVFKAHWWSKLHHSAVGQFLGHPLPLWFFLLYVGLEITIRSIVKGGLLASFLIAGGMIGPFALTYLLTQNLRIALGATATDIAFSLSVAGSMAGPLGVLLIDMLQLLAIGDDLLGIVLMAVFYATAITTAWLLSELAVLFVAILSGEIGHVDFRSEVEIVDNNNNIVSKWQEIRRQDISVQTPAIWLVLGLLNTLILVELGVEPILGACLVMIFAPRKVKKSLTTSFKPLIPLMLFLFGLHTGTINLLDPLNWGVLTWQTALGGYGGKLVGCFSFGLVGLYLTKRLQPDSEYANLSWRNLVMLSSWMGINGTVAIIFVQTAQLAGFITSYQAAQATMGFLLTILISTFMSNLFKLTKLGSAEVPAHELPS